MQQFLTTDDYVRPRAAAALRADGEVDAVDQEGPRCVASTVTQSVESVTLLSGAPNDQGGRAMEWIAGA